ncbi:hypothetical protein H4F33_21210 [Pectobacterium brasiliense]|uniref:hypothetical protein n=1 Tax=Pectobacterium TaxID=122277 RepID=UPI0015DEE0AD|nr:MULTISPECIES: hypothetical protein [Pectobacterium]MBA0219856.1 hypothetical protein [Pectobacterium brasiliense]MBE5212547.1 hypothetical protein [Pectobacterium quasiaquaticum]MBE5225647.1 hypothetical protein [Pectobacterium quasiaquaticum]MBN3066201.1 hypothetical protein [Pectobacterium aquaticum]MBN3074549.1 hypothetical protein [Pectobacterium brasiliense]
MRSSKFCGYNNISNSLEFIYEKNNQPFGINFYYDDKRERTIVYLYRDEVKYKYSNTEIGSSHREINREDVTSIPFLREFFEVNDNKELDKLKKDISDIVYSHLRNGLSLTDDLGFEKYENSKLTPKTINRRPK